MTLRQDDPGANDTTAVLRLTDGVTGQSASVLVARPTLRLPVRELVKSYLLVESKDDQLATRKQAGAGELRRLRQIADLCCDWEPRGLRGGLFRELRFFQNGELVEPWSAPGVETLDVDGRKMDLADVTIDRSAAGYRRNWAGFNARRWRRDAEAYERFTVECVERAVGDAGVDDVLKLDTPDRERALVAALSMAIWAAPFENYSRFLDGGIRFKTGDETVLAISRGDGGICTEKVAAVKFITDHYGIRSEILLGGCDAEPPFPGERLRELLDTFDFRFARRHMRYWQHAALLYWIDDEPMLVDATNGNIPYLCRRGAEARRLLGSDDAPGEPLPVRMMADTERWHYHRTPQDIPLDLLQALEGYLDDADLMQVFDNELGLSLSRRFFVTPLPYAGASDYLQQVRHYQEYCLNAGFAMDADRDWETALAGQLGEEFSLAEGAVADGVLRCRERLLSRYRWREGPEYELGLVLVERNEISGQAANRGLTAS